MTAGHRGEEQGRAWRARGLGSPSLGGPEQARGPQGLPLHIYSLTTTLTTPPWASTGVVGENGQEVVHIQEPAFLLFWMN